MFGINKKVIIGVGAVLGVLGAGGIGYGVNKNSKKVKVVEPADESKDSKK